eukprot:symbB.v1.2.012896.t1/scaffold899.1/size154094/2
MAFEDGHRRTTDLFWLLLFICAVAAQVFFAFLALYHGIQLDELQGGSFEEVLQNVTSRNGWLASAQDAVTNFVELRPENLRLESQGILAALGTAAVSSGGFLLLLAYFPVHLVVKMVAIGGPLALMLLGAMAIADAPPAALLGVEAHLGWPFVILGIIGLIFTSFTWTYLRLGIAVLRCSAAFLRSRPAIGAYPLLFGVVHIAGLFLWALAVLGIRASFQEQFEDLDWQSQFGTASAMLLCFLWGNSFVTGLSTFAVAYAASHWYGRGPADGHRSGQLVPIAIQVGLRYHAGSLALGSLLLALVRTLNVMLWWAEKAQEEATAAATGAVGLPRRLEREIRTLEEITRSACSTTKPASIGAELCGGGLGSCGDLGIEASFCADCHQWMSLRYSCHACGTVGNQGTGRLCHGGIVIDDLSACL